MNKRNKQFLSCDWGTSSFRLRLIETETLTVIAEESSSMGIAGVFRQWQQERDSDRVLFYLRKVQQHIHRLEQGLNASLQNVPVVMSGMASSTLGIAELDYKQLPFAADGSNLEVKKIPKSLPFPNEVFLVSGVKTDDDVMRGEETQLVGCLSDAMGDQVIIFPGTHSKHVFIKNGRVDSFRTYMTGEFFDLLSDTSILCSSVTKGGNFKKHENKSGFQKGLTESEEVNLLSACFRVRTNLLFGRLNKEENYYYLSGLLIGHELRNLSSNGDTSATIVANALLEPLYEFAMRSLFPGWVLKIENVEKAIICGQYKIFKNYKSKE